MGRVLGRRGKVGLAGGMLGITALAAVGCGDDAPPRAPHNQVVRAPVQPAPTVTGPLPDVSIEHSPLTLAAPPAGFLIDARVLVISADGNESELDAIQQTLGYLGTPFDVFIAS